MAATATTHLERVTYKTQDFQTTNGGNGLYFGFNLIAQMVILFKRLYLIKLQKIPREDFITH